ncbi:DUF4625 domain-containing protein [Moheibacter sp.]|uniref:DUF4625 domain-containing protein n=1 Tax=Moheibacter sp. TaxID=1965316 RepID=UPI003C759733
MKNIIKNSMLILIGTFGMISCSSDDDSIDTQKPMIILNQPLDETEFHFGENLHIEAEFSDNVGLASYKIEIHSAGDGHTHKTLVGTEWFHTETHPIAGNPTHYIAQREILIPSEINGEPVLEGHYHLGIYLVDTSGNEQQLFVEVDIHEAH